MLVPSPMTPRLRRYVAWLGILIAVAYAGAVGYLASQETRLVFAHGRPLGPERPAAPFEQVTLASGPDAQTFGFSMPGSAAEKLPLWILYLHGNKATVASRTNLLRCEGLRRLGVNVLAVEYRGFGGLEGTPSEASVTADARAGYEYLRTVR